MIGFDRLSKLLVMDVLKPLGRLTLVKDFLDFSYLENYGAAFGIFQNKRMFFIVVTVFMIFFLLYVLKTKNQKNRLFDVAVLLIIGGGAGNLIDRLLYGFVIDFISFSFFPPVFNVADCFITVGTGLLIVYFLFFSPDKNFQDGEES